MDKMTLILKNKAKFSFFILVTSKSLVQVVLVPKVVKVHETSFWKMNYNTIFQSSLSFLLGDGKPNVFQSVS